MMNNLRTFTYHNPKKRKFTHINYFPSFASVQCSYASWVILQMQNVSVECLPILEVVLDPIPELNRVWYSQILLMINLFFDMFNSAITGDMRDKYMQCQSV